jgi:hypothetical protein
MSLSEGAGVQIRRTVSLLLLLSQEVFSFGATQAQEQNMQQ